MTVTDRIFQNVAELSVPNFFITVEFSVMGNEMPEHIESFEIGRASCRERVFADV